MRRLMVVFVAFVLALAGCATTSPGANISGTGVVLAIQETTEASTGASVAGAIGGAVVGAVLGGQIGGGFGQTVAATAGSIGGSMAGSSIAARASATSVWIVQIRFEDGIDRTVHVKELPAYRPGQRVRVDSGVIHPVR